MSLNRWKKRGELYTYSTPIPPEPNAVLGAQQLGAEEGATTGYAASKQKKDIATEVPYSSKTKHALVDGKEYEFSSFRALRMQDLHVKYQVFWRLSQLTVKSFPFFSPDPGPEGTTGSVFAMA